MSAAAASLAHLKSNSLPNTNNVARRIMEHVLNKETVNQNLIKAQYAVRGELAIRAEELRLVIYITLLMNKVAKKANYNIIIRKYAKIQKLTLLIKLYFAILAILNSLDKSPLRTFVKYHFCVIYSNFLIQSLNS